MALEKSVLMDDGVVRRYHKIFNIQHILDQATYIELVSYQFSPDDGSTGVHTTLTHEFDDDLTFSEAYEWVNSLPEFEEHTSDSETEIQELNTQLTEARATIAEQETAIEETAVQLENTTSMLNTVAVILTDEQALTVPSIYPEWRGDIYYNVGDRVQYNAELYKCLQNHNAQVTWTPEAAGSLWARLRASEVEPDVVHEWVMPDNTNPYMMGDIVTHNGHTWRSTVDNNIWEPSESTTVWEIIDEPSDEGGTEEPTVELTDEPTGDIPEWTQPDSTNPYMAGDEVTHNGSTWRSTVDNNVWEPGVYGWDMLVA